LARTFDITFVWTIDTDFRKLIPLKRERNFFHDKRVCVELESTMKPHRHDNTPDCCRQKSSYSLLKVVLWAGLAILLIAAAVQARAQADNSAASSNQGQVQAQDSNQPPPDQPAPPARQGRVVRLSYVQGQVQILGGGQTEFDQAVANMPLIQGSVVQTGSDGRAEIQFEDGSIARLVPGSQFQIEELGGSSAGSLQTSVSLLSGEGYFELRPNDGDVFIVHSAGLEVTPVQSGSFRINLSVQPQQLAVSDGAVRVNHGTDYKVQVNPDETLNLDDQEPTKYRLTAGTATEPNDAWNEERDQYLNDAAARSTGVQTGGDAAGWDDLDAYGNFYDVPGYGQVWQPYGYDSNWDPFDAGYWAWYPWGYSWISAYPWGWAPYHCGYWNFFPSFGWGWVGGGCGVGIWSPINIWYNPPIGWRRPRRPPWRPLPPQHRRLEPVGLTKDHPYAPIVGKQVPHGWNPGPVTIAGHTVAPLKPLPPGEKRPGWGRETGLSGNRVDRLTPPPAHSNSPTGRSPTWHGGSGYNRPAPAPHAAPPSAPPHSSPPPPSAPSHSESGGGHK
jgi:ferric-dicitrate binding protein FerR (iron transport regulator)